MNHTTHALTHLVLAYHRQHRQPQLSSHITKDLFYQHTKHRLRKEKRIAELERDVKELEELLHASKTVLPGVLVDRIQKRIVSIEEKIEKKREKNWQ